MSETELRTSSRNDDTFATVRSRLSGRFSLSDKHDPALRPFYLLRDELSCDGDLIFFGSRVVIPTELRRRFLILAHDTHEGVVRTKQRLRERYWWPKMDRDIEEAVGACASCVDHPKSFNAAKPPLQPIPLPASAWKHLEIDVIGSLPHSEADRFAIVLCDVYSRWPEVRFFPRATTDNLIQFLTDVFSREGNPERITSDNGSIFVSHRFQTFAKTIGCRLVRSSPYSPQTCGLVERFNRSLKNAILSARRSGEAVRSFVSRFLKNFRATVHPAIGVSPFEAMRGRRMRTALDVLATPEVPVAHRGIRARHASYQAKYTVLFNKRAHKLPSWRPGDMVRVRDPTSRKPRYGPPVTVACRTGPVSYRTYDGERVHARRLVAARKTDLRTEESGAWDTWPAEQERNIATYPTNSSHSGPGSPVPLRRSTRTRRTPQWYDPC